MIKRQNLRTNLCKLMSHEPKKNSNSNEETRGEKKCAKHGIYKDKSIE